MAGHCVLPRAAPVQVGALRQEAHRGPAILPGQAARGGRVWAFCRDSEQGAVEQVGEQAGYRVERVRVGGCGRFVGGLSLLMRWGGLLDTR